MDSISFRELKDKKVISQYSQEYLLSEALKLKVLPVDDAGKAMFCSTDFAEIVDAVTKRFKIESILDLFSGSGALSKIALLNKVRRATCVDIYGKAIEVNLLEFKDRVKIIEGDILTMKFSKHNITVADTPSVLLISVVNKVLSKLNTDLIIMYYGGKGDIKRDRKIENLCKKLFKQTLIIPKHGLKHLCCTSTETGKTYLEFLRKRFTRTP